MLECCSHNKHALTSFEKVMCARNQSWKYYKKSSTQKKGQNVLIQRTYLPSLQICANLPTTDPQSSSIPLSITFTSFLSLNQLYNMYKYWYYILRM